MTEQGDHFFLAGQPLVAEDSAFSLSQGLAVLFFYPFWCLLLVTRPNPPNSWRNITCISGVMDSFLPKAMAAASNFSSVLENSKSLGNELFFKKKNNPDAGCAGSRGEGEQVVVGRGQLPLVV